MTINENGNTVQIKELGSVEGYVKGVGRDGFGRPVVTVTTRIDRQDVKCISNNSCSAIWQNIPH